MIDWDLAVSISYIECCQPQSCEWANQRVVKLTLTFRQDPGIHELQVEHFLATHHSHRCEVADSHSGCFTLDCKSSEAYCRVHDLKKGAFVKEKIYEKNRKWFNLKIRETIMVSREPWQSSTVMTMDTAIIIHTHRPTGKWLEPKQPTQMFSHFNFYILCRPERLSHCSSAFWVSSQLHVLRKRPQGTPRGGRVDP